jgi:hypothetical protein
MQITIPNVRDPLHPLTYDLTSVLAAENRTHEIATVTPSKAPELMATFVKACFDLAKMFAELQYQNRLAERAVDVRGAVVTLEIAPKVIAEKKLGNNAEIREAIINVDPLFNQAVSDGMEIEALLALVRGKLQAMEEALNAVKKVMSEATPSFIRNNPDLVTTQNSIPTLRETQVVGNMTVGKARY